MTVLAACGRAEEKEDICGTGQPTGGDREGTRHWGRLSGQPPESGWYRGEGTAGGQLLHQLQ